MYENENEAQRFRRWYLGVEKTYMGKLEDIIARAGEKNFATMYNPAKAYIRLCRIGKGATVNGTGYRDIGTDEFRFRMLRNKVLAVYLRLALDRLRSGSSWEMVKNKDLIAACKTVWMIDQLYKEEFFVADNPFNPITAGTSLEDYYAVLIKADRALRLSSGRGI